MRCLPLGSSSITLMSSSPYIISPSVRGIGVADIKSVCGTPALLLSAARWTTPKRCCSSVMQSAAPLSSVLSEITACVPIKRSSWLFLKASFTACFSLFFILPSSSPIRHPGRNRRIVSKCWEARMPVGAIRTLLHPFLATVWTRAAATAVLPHPTSP